MFIAATYILLVISICPIIINKMNISTKSSNVIQLPLLLIHSCLIVYVMSAYGAYARKHDHVISWTYHVTATLIGLPWIVWYWHTIETGKERSRLAESQSSTVSGPVLLSFYQGKVGRIGSKHHRVFGACVGIVPLKLNHAKYLIIQCLHLSSSNCLSID